MLLRYNVSHMGQHFWIKQSGMKRSSALVFARRRLLFLALCSLCSFTTAFSAFSCDHEDKRTRGAKELILLHSTVRPGRWVKDHFPRLLKQILAWKRSTAMREKGHQNWPLVIGPWYDPICLSPGDPSASLDQKGIRLPAFPLSKRWVSLTVPLQSLPVGQEAPNKGLPLSPKQRECRKRNTTHIYKIMWHLVFHCNERKNCFSFTELKHLTPGNGLVLLLSCLREAASFSWQEK